MAIDERAAESWSWFGVATVVVILRYVSRAIRLGGWRYFQLEDYVMLLAYGFYTTFIALVNVQEMHPRTNILPPTGLQGISDEEITDRILGSKITFALEESMIMIQFLTKLCMGLLFYKLTSGLKRQLQVKFIIGFVILGWLVTEILFFGFWCHPFGNYFRVIDNNTPGCTTSTNHLILSYCFNVSADLLLLTVPIPMLLQSNLPLKRKLSITGVFSLGVFVIIAATLNRYYSFAHPESIFWIYWYVREASTAMLVSNIPHLYALIRKLVDKDSYAYFRRGGKGSNYLNYLPTHVELSDKRSKKLSGKDSKQKGSTDDTAVEGTESTENLATSANPPLQIWQRNEYSVNGVDASEAQWDEGDIQTIWNGGLGTKATIVSNGMPDEERGVAH